MTTFSKWTALALVLCLQAYPAAATTYYIDSVNGNDGNSGTSSSHHGKTTLTMNTRTGTGINTLNTQLRVALLDDSVNGTLTASDFPNLGFIIKYTNQAEAE